MRKIRSPYTGWTKMGPDNLKNCKVYFWPMEGTVEPVRLMLHLKGIPFEDVVVTGGPEGNWTKELKHSGKPSFEQLPLLELVGESQPDGKPVYISQSTPMAIFVGKLLGFHPTDAFE